MTCIASNHRPADTNRGALWTRAASSTENGARS